jgi:hypothetical protein
MSDTSRGLITAVILLTIGATSAYMLGKSSTSNWWKIQIVSRGYGTWETTTDGQVWFKWKEGAK